ncbi:MAG: phenylalanine--tRNA ligase subunit alpha [Candidatus Gracilibacteria bacterium]|nr:phenylalanine--tRNA ligase subunit alpha [Candidatus Gracilibacteria bacterium]
MLQILNTLQEQVLTKLPAISTQEELVVYKNSIFGKNGELTEILKGVKDLSIEEKQTIGKATNDMKNSLAAAFDIRSQAIDAAEVEERLASEYTDVTFPIADTGIGHLHPLTQVIRQVEDSFTRMGFEIRESMEVTNEYKNFDAVNIPKSHPARDMQDTFWLEGIGNVLATHTSSMQNEIYKTHDLPIRVVIPGRVFRNEDVDATHENTFYQVEAIVVDKGISFANMKYTIRTMLSDIAGKEVKIRLRPSYYPFVEPGADVDFSCPFCDGTGCRICKGTGWIEFMGCGMIHPNVLREGGIDPMVYSGFAFGFGLNRLAMIKYGINDMRYFQNPNVAFLRQF